MCEGEFESLKAIRAVTPTFVPEPYAWGPLKKGKGYFFLAEFRDVGQQPADSQKLALRLAELHQGSVSPTGMFGFHAVTCHGNIPQDCLGWESSWTVMFSRILSRAMDLDDLKNPSWPMFDAVRELFFKKVIPRLLDPLQSEGRSIKPCLVHGDVWDENCADDMNTGEPFAFDAGSFYAHNEYEIGFWRPPRFRLSSKRYVKAYKKHFPMSEPGELYIIPVMTSFNSKVAEDWDARNLLYSIRLNISCSTLIPSSGQKLV
jgi:protein-ribulosamine 3-kinase